MTDVMAGEREGERDEKHSPSSEEASVFSHVSTPMDRPSGRPRPCSHASRAGFGHALLAGLAVLVGACSSLSGNSPNRAERVLTAPGADDRATLTGAGSTFAAPLVQEWARLYRRVAPNVSIDYQDVGSPRGVERFMAGTADFAVSELGLADLGAGGSAQDAVEVPWLAGGVAIAYNLPGVTSLRLSTRTLAAILAGTVSRWDDPSVGNDNAGVALPSTEIRVVHRSDPSGTTQALAQYLTAVAPDLWTLGAGPVVGWVSGIPSEGSQAVTATVERTPGAIGYVSASHAARAAVGTALLENSVGRFVGPTPESVHSAVSRTNPRSPDAYPIATVSFLVFAPRGPDGARTTALRHFAAWALTEGQRSAERLSYAPLPGPFRSQALATVLATG